VLPYEAVGDEQRAILRDILLPRDHGPTRSRCVDSPGARAHPTKMQVPDRAGAWPG
jgi:hypothetical protein